jgi:Dockerin type I domain
MIRLTSFVLATTVLSAALPTVSAQTNIDPAHKSSWGENIGWTNWHDAGSPAGTQGVRIGDTFLSGFIWAENVGWINVGDGTPANGIEYANATGADFGVNRDPGNGELFGLAWGENIGWINFDGGALATPPNPARIVDESGVCRLRGYAWGENVGWINLDHATHFISATGVCDPCDLPGDTEPDGDVDLTDLAILLTNFGLPSGQTRQTGDVNGDGGVNLTDLSLLLANFGSNCP